MNCDSENALYLLLQFVIDDMLGSVIRPANTMQATYSSLGSLAQIAVMALAIGSKPAELPSNAE